ncbi:MAG: hypothetical protein ACREOH_14305 [Candidatus Entotheonellia bacterium]
MSCHAGDVRSNERLRGGLLPRGGESGKFDARAVATDALAYLHTLDPN